MIINKLYQEQKLNTYNGKYCTLYWVWFWLSCLCPLVSLLPKHIKLFGFPAFRLWAYLMKVIPETFGFPAFRLWAYLMKVIPETFGFPACRPWAYLMKVIPETFGFPAFRLWAYLMKVIPETYRERWIWYLRFYFYIQRRDYTNLNGTCYFCKGAKETSDHLLSSCSTIDGVWGNIFHKLNNFCF